MNKEHTGEQRLFAKGATGCQTEHGMFRESPTDTCVVGYLFYSSKLSQGSICKLTINISVDEPKIEEGVIQCGETSCP